MKKYLFLASVAALSFTACTNETEEFTGTGSENQSREISVYALNQNATKSATPAGVFPTDYHFYLSAYAVDAAGDYFGKAEYANEATTVWSGVPGEKQYWPLSPETLNFLAVTKAGSSETTFGTAGANFASKVTVALADNRAAQHDLMYSFARAAVTKDGNTLSFNSGANVGMAFKHALSWVNFTVKAADDATKGAGIVLTGIQLKQAVYNGTATVTLANYNSKTSDLAATLAWDGTAYGSATKYDVDVPGISNIAVNSTSEIAAGSGLMIVPNPNETESVLDPSITTFVISYTLNGKAYTFEYTPTAEQKRMEPAKKYDFNISFRLTEIKVNASVTPWTEINYDAVNVPN